MIVCSFVIVPSQVMDEEHKLMLVMEYVNGGSVGAFLKKRHEEKDEVYCRPELAIVN